MLIRVADAVKRYHVSRSTIMRRIDNGTLTKHTLPDSTKLMLDIDQLDRLFTLRTSRATPESEAPSCDAVIEPVLPSGMAQRLVPHPAELYAAAYRAMHAPRLPRLWARRSSSGQRLV